MPVTKLTYDADGLAQSNTYGNVAATRIDCGYDDGLRLKAVQTYRGPPDIWSASIYKSLRSPRGGSA